MQVNAHPYSFPIWGSFDSACTALLIKDMQRDFCDLMGYVHTRGEDVTPLRAIIPAIQNVLQQDRSQGIRVIYTREGHRPDLSDLPSGKRLKTALSGAEIGSRGPLGRLLVRGEPGWEIIPEIHPQANDQIIDKPGTGAFYSTDLEHILRMQGIEDVILIGVTTGVCVTTTAREASDRGFNVLVLEDCCAEPIILNHDRPIELLVVEEGYIAAVSESSEFIDALQT